MSQRRQHGEEPSSISLPITPMLDMAFQLLMYFLMIYHPSAMEAQMDFSMDRKKAGPVPGPIVNDGPEIPLDLNVHVIARQVGFTITLEEAGVNMPMANLEALGKYLERVCKDRAAVIQNMGPRERVAALRTKDLTIKVQGDSKVKLGSLMEVMDACRMAGSRAFKEAGLGQAEIVGVALASPPDLGIE